MSKSATAFRTISEVADELDVQKHVLRFWEVKFPQIRPMKRGGGRRYYRPEDMVLLRGIQHLLHAEGYTIKGVQKILREQGVEQVKVHGLAAIEAAERKAAAPAKARASSPATSVVASGRVRALPKAVKSAASTPELASPHRFALEQAVRELEACRATLAAPGLKSTATTRPRAARASSR